MQPRIRLAATFSTVFAVAASWWALNSVGTSQPAATAITALTAEGRVEGGGNVFSVGTAATGTVAELMAAPGDHVRKGQHLARIECAPIERELDARKSDLDAAEAALAELCTALGLRRSASELPTSTMRQRGWKRLKRC